MGGTAIRHHITKKPICSRLPKESYEAVKDFILRRLRANSFICETVLELPGKASFGDLDVLLVRPNALKNKNAFQDFVVREFQVTAPWQIVRNGYVTSFAFDCRACLPPSQWGNHTSHADAHLASSKQQRQPEDTQQGTSGNADSGPSSMESSTSEPPPPPSTTTHDTALGENRNEASRSPPPPQVSSSPPEPLQPFPYFQIDLLSAEDQAHLDCLRFYMSFSDVGSILGRILNYYALKFGDQGLWCELLENTVDPQNPFDVRRTLGRVPLTSSAAEICAFLGISYPEWCGGFPSVTATNFTPIFDWIAHSPLFKREIFLTLNTDHRARQQKRPFYGQFLKHIGVVEISHASAESSEAGGWKENLQPLAIKQFGKEHLVKNIVDSLERKKLRDGKFSTLTAIELYKKHHNLTLTGAGIGAKLAGIQRHCVEILTAENGPRPPLPSSSVPLPTINATKTTASAKDNCVDRKGNEGQSLITWDDVLEQWSPEKILSTVEQYIKLDSEPQFKDPRCQR